MGGCTGSSGASRTGYIMSTSSVSPVSFSCSLISLADDYKAPPAALCTSATSTTTDKPHKEELEVTLGQMPSGEPRAEGRKPSIEDLDPLREPFTPFASPPRTMPDIGNLSFSDNGSMKGEQLPASIATPPQGLPSFTLGSALRTPVLSSCPRTSTWSRWDSAHSTSAPYTPYTPVLGKSFGTSSTPATSFSPFEPSTSHPGSIRKDKGKAPEVLRGDEREGAVMSAEEVGRYLTITNIAADITAHDIRDVIKRLGRFKIMIAKHLQTKGCVTIVFYDSREAAKVYNYLQIHSVALHSNSPLVELHCITVSRKDIECDAGHGPNWHDFWQDVESSVMVQIEGTRGVPYDIMKSVCEKVGEVQHLQQVDSGGKEYLVQFWDTRHATELVEVLNNRANGGMTVRARFCAPHEPALPHSRPASAPRDFRRVHSGPARFSVPTPARTLFQAADTSKQVEHDVFGPFRPINTNASGSQTQSIWPFSRAQSRTSSVERPTDNADTLPRPYGSFATPYIPPRPARREPRGYDVDPAPPPIATPVASSRFAAGYPIRQGEYVPPSPSTAVGAFGKWGATGWNRKMISPDKRINLQMIENGQEERTTVMVKDVPNKLSRQELVDILSDVVPGGFDFVYLRFDFKNACNVGYAFVNFTSLEALHTFHSERVGQKWNLFSSEKVLQICWADIQGKERLINKFRNSDVMTAPEPWRPQIFYTSGPLQGCPEPFPEPDHPSRMRSNYLRHTAASASIAGYEYDNANDYNYTSADFDASYGL